MTRQESREPITCMNCNLEPEMILINGHGEPNGSFMLFYQCPVCKAVEVRWSDG